MRVLVVGSGALGGVIAGHLAASGHEVTLLFRDVETASVVRERGLLVGDRHGVIRTEPRVAVGQLDSEDPAFRFVLLATQPTDAEAAMRGVLPWLAKDGRVVCFQNGLCEERIARLAGQQRVVGGVVFWGASVAKRGHVMRTSAGGFALGMLDGSIDGALLDLRALLSCIGPVKLTTNLRGVRWSKLAINCAMSTFGTIGGEPVGVLMQRYDARQLGIEVIGEAVRVALAEGVYLERVAGWIDLRWLLVPRLAAAWSAASLRSHLLVFTGVIPYRRLRSSMLAAIQRGRAPAVDFLNGEVVERAERHGIEVPVNRAAQAAVWAIARGELVPSTATLHELFRQTRDSLQTAAT